LFLILFELFRQRQLDDDSDAFVIVIEISDELHDFSHSIIILIDIDADIIEFSRLIPIILNPVFSVGSEMILSEDDDRKSDGITICFLAFDIGSGRIIVSQENDGDISFPITEYLSSFLDKLLFQ